MAEEGAGGEGGEGGEVSRDGGKWQVGLEHGCAVFLFFGRWWRVFLIILLTCLSRFFVHSIDTLIFSTHSWLGSILLFALSTHRAHTP